ncbi:fimbria/pilus outer membrane usher protein [Altererythrobacter sp. Root672]|uniref:fimbria/pilus outer membrane usher protein n=1 Tax=Altererythrobacter sp. Root672 TaxID=1736584 RepID=UPI0006F736C9|nr:fimbria/pilus outer membrane usher protein [Altererythrobacter sp. Root672]KRA83626.1 hypothetical protein ASD76_06230 [Altererythrobacter sp. Root672]
MSCNQARAQADTPVGQYPLVLEVYLNGRFSPQLWEFVLLPDGRIAITPEKLQRLGFDLEALGVSTEQTLVVLGELPGVRFRYIENQQSIEIEAVDEDMVPVQLDAASAPVPIDPDKVEQNLGVMLNYSFFGDFTKGGADISTQYELRLLSPFGVLTSTGFGILASSGLTPTGHVRLETYWRYVDARSAIAFSAGDVIAAGGELGNLYRLGGLQVQRDFGSRPDLVTHALPILSGTAAVPSTVDLYINGMRYFTGQTGRGPFEFRSLPNVGGGATATVVLTDATGRETRIQQPIFFAPSLLPRGMLDFSVEAGFPRFAFGVRSLDYLKEPAASGSIRYGLTDWLTVRAHAEGMKEFGNGSAGATFRIGGIGTISGEFAASTYRGNVSTRYSIEVEGHIGGVNFYAGRERTQRNYQDVVRETDRLARLGRANQPDPDIPVPSGGSAGSPLLVAFSSKVDRAGASFSLFDTGVSLNYTRLRLSNDDAKIASASLSRTLFGRVSIWANGFKDLGERDDYGAFVGLSLALGKRITASSSYSKTNHSELVSARVWRDPEGTVGSWGWSLAATEPLGGDLQSHRSATVRYHAGFATLEGGLQQDGGDLRATAYVEGSIVGMGGGVFLSPRIDDSFAVVTGAGADTPVLSNTRLATQTDSSGRALVPFLSSFQENLVSIDPINLPVDLRPARTEAVVIPGDRAGVVIDYGVEKLAAAIVILVDSAGEVLPVGSVVTLEGSSEPAVVGFDGRAYLTGLAPHNSVQVQRPDAPDCAASFDFTPVEGEQILIGPLTCR